MTVICIDCIHEQRETCAHPAVSRDLVTGNTSTPACRDVRASDGRCGPEGRLWQAKRRNADAGPPEAA